MNTPATPNTPDTATIAFLDALNSATGPAIETLTPADARRHAADGDCVEDASAMKRVL